MLQNQTRRAAPTPDGDDIEVHPVVHRVYDPAAMPDGHGRMVATKLSAEALRELQQIWKQETGQDITLEEADAMGVRILKLFRLLEKPPAQRRGSTTH